MTDGGRQPGLAGGVIQHATSSLSIFYIGPRDGTCLHRRRALERLGHNVCHVDPAAALPCPGLAQRWSFHTGAAGLQGLIGRHLLKAVAGRSFDLLWVDSGEMIGPPLLAALRRFAPVSLLLNNDNPFVGRDGQRWRLLRKALPLYDLFVTPRQSTADAAKAAGCRHILRVGFAADEIAHRPLEPRLMKQGVVFAGTWMPERGPVLRRLIERGVPLRIYGGRWHKAPEFQALRPSLVQGALDDVAYRQVIGAAAIAIGLLSKGNEDLHTTRSLEIPAMGTVLAAERTTEHLAMYREGVEAVFWADADECADHCLGLLGDVDKLEAMTAAGRRRVLSNQAFNETLAETILARIAVGMQRDGRSAA